MLTNNLAENISLIFMAIALGMDAFSVSLGIGMKRLRLKRIALIGMVIGSLHITFPFFGIIVGQFLSHSIGHLTSLASGIILVGIGVQMFLSAYNYELKDLSHPYGWNLLILSITVSVDSFPVGLSLGLSGVKTLMVLILFGTTSMLLCWTGMFLGRKVRGLLGAYSEFLGGSILIVFGLHIIFS